jgi:hypothetical protein
MTIISNKVPEEEDVDKDENQSFHAARKDVDVAPYEIQASCRCRNIMQRVSIASMINLPNKTAVKPS